MSDLTSRIAIHLYGAFGYVLVPFAGLLIFFRRRVGKEDRKRYRERYGIPSADKNGRSVIWVHAASLGETNAVLPLIRRMVEKNFQVVLTTVTVTAAEKAVAELPEGAVHQFVPLDLKPFSKRFLKHWRPSLAIFVESELWPATMANLKKRNIPQIIVNGRMSERSYERWKSFSAITHNLFSNVALCVAQSNDDLDRFYDLGITNVTLSGNLKFDTEPLDFDSGAFEQLRAAIGGRPIWLAASTHENEEAIVAKAHNTLKQRFPNLLTIIVPRHPHRGEMIVESLAKIGLKTKRRTTGGVPDHQTEVFVADTVGELGLFYRLSPCSLVGGSLVPKGGQNPIEPARLGSAIVFGPNTANFAEIFAALEEHGAGHCVRDLPELVARVADILENPDKQQAMTKDAAGIMESFTGALDRTYRFLVPFLNPLIIAGSLANVEARNPARK